MPPKVVVVEDDMTLNEMVAMATHATTKQFEEIPMAVLVAIGLTFGVKVRKTYNVKSGKTTYERKSAT